MGQGAFDDKIGGNDPEAYIVPGPLQFLVHLAAEGFQSGEIGIGIGGCLDDVGRTQEIRRALIGSGKLGQDIGLATAIGAVIEPAIAFGGILQAEQDGVVIDRRETRQGRAINGLQTAQLVCGEGLVLFARGQGGIGEFELGLGPVTGVETKGRDEFGRLVEGLLEDLVQQGAQLLLGRGHHRQGGGCRRGHGRDGLGGGTHGAASQGQASTSRKKQMTAIHGEVLKRCGDCADPRDRMQSAKATHR